MKIQHQLVGSDEMTYGGTSACSTVTVHETANTSAGADAQAHANLQSGGNLRTASWHLQVDDHQAIRSFPDEAQCWHAGSEAKHSIAIELCVNSDGDYEATLRNAAEVVAQLCRQHELDEMNVVGHVFWTGKHCPAQMLGSGRWDSFIADIRAHLHGNSEDSAASGSTGSDDGGDSWPDVRLLITEEHTTDSHSAWVKLLADVGFDDDDLTVNFQEWLAQWPKYDVGPADGDFGPRTVKALQRFLAERDLYDGLIDGDRGELTVKAEIRYLNDQRIHY